MSKNNPDEFDSVSGVGGRYLAPKRAVDYIISFLTLTAVSAVLAAGALSGLRFWDMNVEFPEQLTEEPSVPQLAIAIVDGTNSGLSVALRDELMDEGWNIVSALALDELDPNLPVTPTTLIFITQEQHRSVAKQLLTRFPQATIELSAQFIDPITVLLGADFLR